VRHEPPVHKAGDNHKQFNQCKRAMALASEILFHFGIHCPLPFRRPTIGLFHIETLPTSQQNRTSSTLVRTSLLADILAA